MTLIPELHDSLAHAVASPRAHERWWRQHRRAGLLAVGALIVTGSAFAATGGWRPVLGTNRGGHPRDALTPVPPGQSAQLGVLRRPQTAADRSPLVLAVLRLLVSAEINGVNTNDIRLLRRRTDGVTILVPAERVGRQDPRYPSSIERQVVCVLTSVHVTSRVVSVRNAQGTPRTARTFGGLMAGQVCGGVPQLLANKIAGSASSDSGFIFNGLVPDGVARVIVYLRAPRRRVTATVRDNLYEVNVGAVPRIASIQWLDGRGHTIGPR